jgi:endonuclease/exonuclease/phosphatase family metal-dependent hydrolase
MRVRVAAYNVHGFRAGVRGVLEALRPFEPDILVLNETGGRLALRGFARRAGMELARDPWSPFRRRVKNAVLVRPPWRIVDHRLHRFADVRRPLNPRGALVAHVGRAGRRVWVLGIHLGLHPLERLNAVTELCDLARGLEGPVLIAGDTNELPDGRAMTFLGERFWDAWLLGGDVEGETFPASDPTARIDYVFVSEGVRVERVLVPASDAARKASDHLPVVAELTLTDPDEARAGPG